MTRILSAVALALAILSAHAQEIDIPGLARNLDRAATGLPVRGGQDDIRARAVMLAVLATDGRLASVAALSKEDIEAQLDRFVRDGTASPERSSVASGFPPADTIVFDGHRLAGGNFRNIDAIFGVDGSPVALDREPPVLMVPLREDQAMALATVGDGLDAGTASGFKETFGAAAAERFIADGIAMRPYAGRADDLYFHLVQKGTRADALGFHGLREGLSGRGYHPLTGLAAAGALPPTRFNLGDVLSGGALAAVARFRSEHPGVLPHNPFSTFALRVLPHLAADARTGPTGAELRVSSTLVQRALADPRRFAAPAVPPLFEDRSRFLGMSTRSIIRVANRSGGLESRIAEVEAETLLPDDPGAPATDDLLGAPVANEWIDGATISPDAPAFDSDAIPPPEDANPPFVDEEMETSSEETRIAGADEPDPQTPEPAIAQDASAPSVDGSAPPPPAPPSRYHVALLAPTSGQARAYLEAIATNDHLLADNLAESRRILCYRRWVEESLPPLEEVIAHGRVQDTASLAQIESTIKQARTALAKWKSRSAELQKERLEALEVRGAVRRELEERVQREGNERLREIGAVHAA